jgi:hypothetical protein
LKTSAAFAGESARRVAVTNKLNMGISYHRILDIISGMRIGFVTLALMFVVALPSASATPECEKKMTDTGMMVLPADAGTICETLNPNTDSQNCIVEVLAKRKGNLCGSDLFEVAGTCKVDGGQAMRNCLIRELDRPCKDPAYKGAKKAGDICMGERLKSKIAARAEARAAALRAQPRTSSAPATTGSPATAGVKR